MDVKQLDCRELLCPLPVLKIRQVVRTLEPGDRLRVLTTDPGALEDVRLFCLHRGHKLLEQHTEGPTTTHVLEV